MVVGAEGIHREGRGHKEMGLGPGNMQISSAEQSRGGTEPSKRIRAASALYRGRGKVSPCPTVAQLVLDTVQVCQPACSVQVRTML